MLTEKTIPIKVFVTSDGTPFYENHYSSYEDAKEAAERYESQFTNPLDVTFNHGFEVGDISYYSSDRDKLYKVEVTKIEKSLETQWIEYDPTIEPYYNRDNWHFNEPAWIDKITIKLLSTGEEETIQGDFIKVRLKKTVEEFVY